jgi:hypothetical protein
MTLKPLWLKVKASWVWRHKTKVLGGAAVGVAYGQNNLAQLGHVIPPAWQGGILAGFGVLAFIIGLCNTLIPPDL